MSIDSSTRPAAPPEDLREQALTRLKSRRDLGVHAMVYVLVNGFLVVVWALATPDAMFWPVFPMAAWGIGLVMNAWDVYRGDRFSEADIQREMALLQRR